jgi:hypothetical protein
MAAPNQTLTCSGCGYANEPERVYCHNCGSKLDRSLLPREDEGKKKESLEKTRKRVRRMTNPGEGGVAREVKAFFKTIIWAAVVAALILFVLPPSEVPEKNPTALPTRILSSELTDAVESPQPRSLQLSEADVNAHLKQSLKKATGGLPGVKFERAFVKFDPNVCRITMEQSLWGYSLYSGSSYSLAVQNDKLVATTVGGHFGRLAVHPKLMEYADFALKKLWDALKREREQMDKLRDIRISKGQIILVTRGKAQ